jgi:uncharacterized protein (TIGR02444 family)
MGDRANKKGSTMKFWTWALEAYGRPGAAEACLDLQDHHRQCVPYLLWGAWAAREGRLLDQRTLEQGADLSARWEAAAVGPLRTARRAMKPEVPGISDAAREGVRAEVKALELQAEQLLIEALEAIAPAPGPAELPLRPALAAATAAWAAEASETALDRLAQTLS